MTVMYAQLEFIHTFADRRYSVNKSPSNPFESGGMSSR